MNKPWVIVLRWTIVGVLAGLLSSCTLGAARIFGSGDAVWANWQSLGAPPEKPDRIIGTESPARGTYIIVAAHDHQYACCSSGPGLWTAVTPETTPPYLDYRGSTGSYIVNMPGDVLATATTVSCAEFCGDERHYVIRADGTVWTWGTNEADGQPQSGILLSGIVWPLGIVSGLLVGILLAVLPKLRSLAGQARASGA